jgi:hypothetical protein
MAIASIDLKLSHQAIAETEFQLYSCLLSLLALDLRHEDNQVISTIKEKITSS